MGEPVKPENWTSVFTDVDLNTDATTDVLNNSRQTKVYRVELPNGGSTADIQLEITDGSNTHILDNPSAGNAISFTDTIVIDADETLQVNVTTVEGSAQTDTCYVSRGNQAKAPTG